MAASDASAHSPAQEAGIIERLRPNSWWITLGLILLVALALRLWQLGTDSAWIDEINVIWHSQPDRVLDAVRSAGPFEPPLSFLLTSASLQLPLSVETAARLPMALFGAIEVLAVYLLGREITGRRRVGLVAAALLAVAPFAVRYSQEARYYTMFSALHLLSWWMLLRALRGQRGSWAWYGGIVGLMLMTHPFAPVVVLFQLAVVLGVLIWRRRSTAVDETARSTRGTVRGLALSGGVALAIALPWWIFGALEWIGGSSDTRYRFNEPGTYGVQVDLDLFRRGADWLLGNAPDWTLLAVLLSALVVAAPLVARGRERWIALGIAGYVVVFTVVLVLLAHAIETYFAYRRVEFLIAPLLLMAALALVGFGERLRAWGTPCFGANATVFGVCGLLVAISMLTTVNYYDTAKTPYNEAAALIRDLPPDTVVVLSCVTPAGWQERLDEYFTTLGVDHDVFLAESDDLAEGPPAKTRRVVWISGNRPTDPGLDPEPLQGARELGIIGGDRSWGNVLLPLYTAEQPFVDNEQFLATLESQLAAQRCTEDASP